MDTTEMPAPERPRTAICLCGGGVTGAMYEIGAMMAIEDWLGGAFDMGRLDMYVGTSAGALIATLMAAGIRPRRVFRAMLDPEDDFVGAQRHHVYQLDAREFASVIAKLARIVLAHGARTLRGKPARLREMAADLDDALPSGLFSLQHYERFLWRFFERHGIPTRFSGFRPELYITANDLDSGHRVVFGEKDAPDVPVPVAIAASSAIPLFFEPMRIGGRDYVDGAAGKVAHTDVAIHHGARLILVINPMVPARNDPAVQDLPTAMGPRRRLRDKGMLAVWDQAMRINTKTKLHLGLRRWAAERPDVRIFLIEPEEEEAHLLFGNVMSFSQRNEMMRFGYDSARRQIAARSAELEAALRRAGIVVEPAGRITGSWQTLKAV